MRWNLSKETQTRTLVGVLLAALVIWMLFGVTTQYLVLAFCLMAFIGWREYLRIFEMPLGSKRGITGILFLWAGIVDCSQQGVVTIKWIWIFWVVSLFFLVMETLRSQGLRENRDLSTLLREYTFYFTGLLYNFFLFGFMGPLLKSAPVGTGKGIILLTLLVVFSGDIGAYFIGRKCGKRKLWPLVSPKKTVEGAFGGVLGSLLGALLFVYIWHLLKFPALDYLKVMFFALIAAPLAQAGDFLESFFKRVSGVKDSGRLLPGHGGLLDRIDGLVLIWPLAYFIFV